MLTTPPFSKLTRFQNPIYYTVKSVVAHGLVAIVWLQWREPAHNLLIPVGAMESVVETSYHVAAVGITVADGDRIGSLGHGTVPYPRCWLNVEMVQETWAMWPIVLQV